MKITNESLPYGFIGLLVDEIPSTNTFLKESFVTFNNKTVLIAKKQTLGRGRYNRVWESADDIIFSILFKENNYYSIIAPLAITLALKDININASIKWPNDIYVDNKKLSGILIEDVYQAEFKASIVGMGINMNSYPSVNGIGIKEYSDISNKEFINIVLSKFNRLLMMDIDIIMDFYKKYNFVIGKNIKYHNEIYKAIDITKEGYLVIEANNIKQVITSDEIDIKTSLM